MNFVLGPGSIACDSTRCHCGALMPQPFWADRESTGCAGILSHRLRSTSSIVPGSREGSPTGFGAPDVVSPTRDFRILPSARFFGCAF